MILFPTTPLDPWIKKKMGLDAKAFATREDIRRVQLEKLRKSLAHAAKNSPFYRRRFSGRTDFSGLDFEEFHCLPFTTDEDVREDPLAFLCGSQSEVARVVTLQSSGTTGGPKRIFFSQKDLESTVDFFRQGMSTFVREKDRVLILMPGPAPGSIGDLLVKGLKRMGATGIVHGPVKDPEEAVRAVLDLGINCLVGIPIQVLSMVRSPEDMSIPRGMIRHVLLSTDYVPNAIVTEIEQKWGCEVFQHYGMTEMGYGCAVECHAHNGAHLREADLFVEIIDPDTGRPLPEGVSGEVVFTSLDKRAMPLIRYRTGDGARFLPEYCPCGSILRRLGKVQGRLDQRAVLGKGVRIDMALLDEAVFAIPEVLDFQAELTGDNGLCQLNLTLHCSSGRLFEIPALVKNALNRIPSIKDAGDRGLLEIGPIEFCSENRFTTGAAKRTLVDRRQEK